MGLCKSLKLMLLYMSTDQQQWLFQQSLSRNLTVWAWKNWKKFKWNLASRTHGVEWWNSFCTQNCWNNRCGYRNQWLSCYSCCNIWIKIKCSRYI